MNTVDHPFFVRFPIPHRKAVCYDPGAGLELTEKTRAET
jgi:hypothetical protein